MLVLPSRRNASNPRHIEMISALAQSRHVTPVCRSIPSEANSSGIKNSIPSCASANQVPRKRGYDHRHFQRLANTPPRLRGCPYLSTQSNVQTLPCRRRATPPLSSRKTLRLGLSRRGGAGPHERRRHRHGGEVSEVFQEARDGSAVAGLDDPRARTSICPARTRISKHGCGKVDGLSSTPPSSRSNRDPCQGQRIDRPSTWPSERGPPRCAQLSASA